MTKDKKDRKKHISVHTNAGLRFPVTRIRNAMKLYKRNTVKQVGLGASLAMTAVLEQVIAEVLEGAVNNVKEHNDNYKTEQKTVKPKNLFKSIEEDDELEDLFKDCSFKMEHCGSKHREILPELQAKGKKKKDDDE